MNKIVQQATTYVFESYLVHDTIPLSHPFNRCAVLCPWREATLDREFEAAMKARERRA